MHSLANTFTTTPHVCKDIPKYLNKFLQCFRLEERPGLSVEPQSTWLQKLSSTRAMTFLLTIGLSESWCSNSWPELLHSLAQIPWKPTTLSSRALMLSTSHATLLQEQRNSSRNFAGIFKYSILLESYQSIFVIYLNFPTKELTLILHLSIQGQQRRKIRLPERRHSRYSEAQMVWWLQLGR